MSIINRRLGLSRYEADEYYRLALEAYQKKRLDDAILNMDDAIALLPGRSEYWAARGFFYLEDGVLDKAQADFEQALKLHRFEMLAHYGRGVIAYKDRNWQEALAHFTDAYRSDPKRPETLYYLALCFHRTGDNAAAQRFMEQAAAAFANVDERRRADALKWVKEFQRILGSAARLPPPG
ncbi:MAG: tetratricopeptide repeat protein [Chloroflexi bacterium]|nr:tetratricopeptide repeat protein [Chloroflexota bacterium]MDL1883582.1 tetratricopeptide repeat protein [Anaerolineae bacterium CFX8]